MGDAGFHAFPGKGHQAPEQAELRLLRDENWRLRLEETFLKKNHGLLCQPQYMRYVLIQSARHPFALLRLLCAVLHVSRSGFYRFVRHER